MSKNNMTDISMDAQNSHLRTLFPADGPPPPRPPKSKNRVSFIKIESEKKQKQDSDGGDWDTSCTNTPTTIAPSVSSLVVNSRSKARSIFLVLSCAGAMILNVGSRCKDERYGADLGLIGCERDCCWCRSSDYWKGAWG